MFSLVGLRESAGDAIYYDHGFRQLLESHRLYLTTASGVTWKEIPQGEAWRWRYDFYGLLQYLDIPQYLRWIILRCNDLQNPVDYTGLVTTILLPPVNVIANLAAIYQNSLRTE